MVRIRNFFYWYWPIVLYFTILFIIVALILFYPRSAHASTPKVDSHHPAKASSIREEEPFTLLDQLNAHRNIQWSAQLDTAHKSVSVYDPNNQLTCFASPIYAPADPDNAAGFTVTCIDRSAMPVVSTDNGTKTNSNKTGK